MKLVVTDGHTLNPGDLCWEWLNKYGKVDIYPRTSQHQIVERCKDATIIVVNKTPISRPIIDELPNLQYIAVSATGVNNVAARYARQKNILLSNVKAYGSSSVSQHTFALLLALCNKVKLHHDSVQAGQWSKSPDFCYQLLPIQELAGKTMGIIGYGAIGRQLGKIAHAFDMNIVIPQRKYKQPITANYINQLSLTHLLSVSDVVCLHVPLNQQTKHLINTRSLALMRPSAYLINTARGDLIDEAALAKALNNKQIAGAALDVLSEEPPKNGNVLINAPNCIITPHNAWGSFEARQRLMNLLEQNIQSFIDDNPINIIN